MSETAFIGARDLTVRRGGRTVLSDVSLGMERGRITGLIGPNGVGKSSMLLAAGGLLPYQSGSLTLGGVEVGSDPMRARLVARSVFSPASSNRALTGAAYLAFLRTHRKASFRPAMAERLTDALGIRSYLDRPIGTYSVGTSAKIALIAALAFKAEAYLLDEALNGLDHRSVRALSTILADEASAGRCIVVASQVLPMLYRLCDAVTVLTGQGEQASWPGARDSGGEDRIEAALAVCYDEA